ncbi:MAG: Gfo/Idh/MocA family oxidoreductase, partial [Gordonia sp. (in: high G+C Gram-positive bacteria)]
MAQGSPQSSPAARVGIVGTGFMARVHAHAARVNGARVVAVASSTAESARRGAYALGVDRSLDSVAALIDSPDIDVVHICSPNVFHAEQASRALASGKHVICEKPIATTLDDATELLRVAQKYPGQVTAVPFVYRYHPMVREARARVAGGSTGRLLTIHGSYLQDWLSQGSDDNWRVSSATGGPSRAFADIGSHLVDLIEYITGARITRLSARRRTFLAHRDGHRVVETEDAMALVVETADGAIGTLLISQMAPGHKNSLVVDISFSDETLIFEQEQPNRLIVGARDRVEILQRGTPTAYSDTAIAQLPPGHPMGYQDAFNAFVAEAYSARVDTADALPTFIDGLRAVEITDAALRAAAGDSWVTLGA